MIETTNPTTGEHLAFHKHHSPERIEQALASSWRAFCDWRNSSFANRSLLLEAVAAALEAERENFSRLMVREMGKPLTAARAEIDKCAWVCRYYAANGEEQLRTDHVDVGDDAHRAMVRFDPLGPLLAIMPWNFPFWQLFRAAAPSLMAGNTVVLKHASNVPDCAKAIEQVFLAAGADEGLFQTLIVDGPTATEIIADDRIRAVTLTGSVDAGRKVAAAAGKALKPVVLELGGSDPFIVLADADLGRAAEVGATSRMVNNGQSCIAAKRFIVVDEVADAFTDALVERIAAMPVGDPMREATQVGPLARSDLRENLADQVARTIDAGGRVALGGEQLDRPGWFYAPTVLANVTRDAPAATEETFGPVAAVVRVADQDEAIEVANDSAFGLGASLWTEDRDRGEALARRIDAGAVFVNQLVKSDPRVPFGGVKDSGFGRELGSYGIKEFVNAKTVWVQ